MALYISKTARATVVDELSGSVAASGTYTVAQEAVKSSHHYSELVVEKSTDNTTFSAATLDTDYSFNKSTGVLTNITAGALYYRIDYVYHDVASTDGTNALTTQHPIAGSAVEGKYYLFNDDATKYYESINIDPTDATGTDESAWIQMADDVSGVAGTYGAGSAALSMANIGSSTGADTSDKPFWAKVTTPVVDTTQNKTDIKLTTNFTEFAV
jgi:hypothetical protein